MVYNRKGSGIMKKISLLLTTILISLISFNTMYAVSDEQCSLEEENAKNVSAYVDTYFGEYTTVHFDLKIENVTEDVYVRVTNDYDNTTKDYYYKDSDNGTLVIPSPNVYRYVKYIVKVYTKDSECGGEAVQTLNLKTNIYNGYSNFDICKKAKEPIDICYEFKDTSNLSVNEFMIEAQKEIDYLNRSFLTKLLDFIKEYYMYILIPIILIGAYYIVRIVILKRSRNEKYNK